MIIRLQPWQWIVLALPIAAVVGFLMVAAGLQIHDWGLNWIWAVILVVFVGWRFLLVRWLRPLDISLPPELPTDLGDSAKVTQHQQAEAKIQALLQTTREDGPPWQNWPLFFQRCQQLVEAIALVYAPQSKRPLLNIYVPQAYGLLRGTVDDVGQWMQKLSPVLGQVTIEQAVNAYETYQRLEPAARLAIKAWNYAQWVLNPFVALARTTTQGYSTQANQALVMNLGQMMREATLKALGERAIALYSGSLASDNFASGNLASGNLASGNLSRGMASPTALAPKPQTQIQTQTQTQTLRDIFTQTSGQDAAEQQPLNLLIMGRTGAGKSSLINTLFRQELAAVDVLPSTDEIQSYSFETPDGETLLLWDTPGFEQIGEEQYREDTLAKAAAADVVLLLTPATDPTLQMDLDLLSAIHRQSPDLPRLTVVTQVDKLRPLREWEPPYDWHKGDRPKEKNIRDALAYRESLLKEIGGIFLPLVTEDRAQGRSAWGDSDLAQAILNTLEPAQQFRISRFLRDLDIRTQTAAKIIDHYTFQIATTQGLTALLKSPALKFLSTLLTGSPALAIVLAERLPIEESPVVLGKLQMAYELYMLLSPAASPLQFDVLSLWPLLLERSASLSQETWALGHALAEYWVQPSEANRSDNLPLDNLPLDNLRDRYRFYLSQTPVS